MEPITNMLGTLVFVVVTNWTSAFIPPEKVDMVKSFNMPTERMRIGQIIESQVVVVQLDGNSYYVPRTNSTKIIKNIIEIGDVTVPEIITWKQQVDLPDQLNTETSGFATNAVVISGIPKKKKSWYQFWKK
jgi:hypothetical protein